MKKYITLALQLSLTSAKIRNIYYALFKTYLVRCHIFPILKEYENETIFRQNNRHILDVINSAPFYYGILDRVVSSNNYTLNVKDIAMSINMGLWGHSSESFIKQPVIDVSFYLAEELKKRFITNSLLIYMCNVIGKDHKLQCSLNVDRSELECIFNDKNKIYDCYFRMFENNAYSNKMTIFYPVPNSSYIDFSKENSLTINICKKKINRGFFLVGFEYNMDNQWLSCAIRTHSKECFNEGEGDIVWLN